MSVFDRDRAESVFQAADLILSSKYLTVITGAGVSTSSGIPDFRSENCGLWQRFSPFEVASLETFRYRPDAFYNWFHPLATDIYKADPNASHFALTKLEKNGFVKAIITQNIDGLHQKSGAKNVVEVHGSLNTLSCGECHTQFSSASFLIPYIEHQKIPHCIECERILKPDIVFFGEQLPIDAWLNAKKYTQKCDVMIIAGSSLEVIPTANLPKWAYENHARIILINQSETYFDAYSDVVIREDTAEILPAIVNEVLNE